jgi:hypothetical protein
MSDLTASLKRVDTDDLAPLTMIDDDRRRALWLLALAKSCDLDPLTPAEISDALRDAFGTFVSRQRIGALLQKDGSGTVAPRRKNGRRAYQVMERGLQEIQSAPSGVVLVEPEGALTAIREVETILRTLRGDLSVCDPHVDSRTLDLLGEASHVNAMRLLTVNVHKEQAFRRDLKAWRAEHRTVLEVRRVAPGLLHDRYLIDDKRMFLIGTSLNGLGFKESFVVAAGSDMRFAVLAAFNQRWASANPL